MEWTSHSAEETEALGERVITEFPEVKLICLKGPLGSGKTHFTKGIGRGLGIAPEKIKSPTFMTLMEHHGSKKLYHCDFYRWGDGNMVRPIDWWYDLLEAEESLVVAEWSERIQHHLPERRVEIEIDFKGNTDSQRTLTLHFF